MEPTFCSVELMVDHAQRGFEVSTFVEAPKDRKSKLTEGGDLGFGQCRSEDRDV